MARERILPVMSRVGQGMAVGLFFALFGLLSGRDAGAQGARVPVRHIPVQPLGKLILPADLTTSYSVYGADSLQIVPVTDASVPFKEAFKIQRNSAGQFFYSAGLSWEVTQDLADKDFLVLSFWVKNLNSDLHPLHVTPVLQDNVTYNKSLTGSAPSDLSTWVKYAIPFRMTQSSQVSGNGSSMIIFFGDLAQEFEIGGIHLQNMGQIGTPIPRELTSTFSYYYPGRGNAQAPWRLTAQKNIEATRMANLTVKVTDAGVGVANATVQVNETAADFHWGSAIDGCNVDGQCLNSTDTATYKANILKNFNTVVTENDLKWPEWECCLEYATDAIDFAQKNNLALRGHNLIWPNFDNMPSDTASLSPTALTTRINNHFENEEGTLKGEIYEWDVVNEPFGNNQVQGLIPGVPGVTATAGVLGNTAIAGWYALAGQIDPNAVLNMNDGGIFDGKSAIQEAYDLALVKYIKANGGTVEGFSFESHFDQTSPVFSEMQATLNDFDPYISKYGVTEFDFATIDPALQRDLTADYMTFIFGQPKFNEFLMWGFWDGAHWMNSAPIYNLNWTLKPSGEVWQQLTQKTWQTHTSGATSATGAYAVRAFKGSYSLTASAGGKSCTVPLTLSADALVTIKLECN